MLSNAHFFPESEAFSRELRFLIESDLSKKRAEIDCNTDILFKSIRNIKFNISA